MKPSHLTLPQVARAVGVSREAVHDRVAKGRVEVVEFFGTPMIRWGDVWRWQKERDKRGRKMLLTQEIS